MPSPCLSDERVIMRTKWREEEGKESMCICLTGFCFFLLFRPTSIFSKITLLCAIIQAPCWNNVTESNAIFPFAPSPICAPEKLRVMHNILSALLFNIILNNAIRCPFVGIYWLKILKCLYFLPVVLHKNVLLLYLYLNLIN